MLCQSIKSLKSLKILEVGAGIEGIYTEFIIRKGADVIY